MKLLNARSRDNMKVSDHLHSGRQGQLGRSEAMSPSGSPAPARSAGSGFEIKVREKGGIRGIERTVALVGNILRVLDRGQIRIERHLPASVVQALVEHVRELEKVKFRRTYGRYGYASDIMTTELEIRDESNGFDVEVFSDPNDPPPKQFWVLVDKLEKLTRADFKTTAAEF
jgi:hypothetical protein